ncbi:MAG: TetR/AcrR family transcriptional regulator [Chloroflexota bacterium]
MTDKNKDDRRVRRTRKLMQDALIRLIRRKPLAKIQIKEIVEEADVSRSTFYKHFETKEQVLFSLIEDLFEKVRITVFDEREDGEEFNIMQLLTLSYEQWLLYSEELKWVLQVENKDLLISALRSHIEMLKNEVDKNFPPNPTLKAYEDHVISFVSGGVYMLVKNWISTGMKESAETMGKITFLLIDNGFAPMRMMAADEDMQAQAALEAWRAVISSLPEGSPTQ